MKKVLSMFIISSSLLFANNNDIGLDTIIGATIGVAIGNQIGHGSGRDAAKVAGGVLGAVIANSSRPPQNQQNNYYNSQAYYPQQNIGYVGTPVQGTTVINNYYNNDPYYRPQTSVNINYLGGFYGAGFRNHHYSPPRHHYSPRYYKKSPPRTNFYGGFSYHR
jgi:hypothetical protein